MRYATRNDAYAERGGVVAADPVVESILGWLLQIGVRREALREPALSSVVRDLRSAGLMR